MVETVRSFNRTVTQRIGALSDHYLGRGRPLGEARVLWEIGEQGCDVRALRERLRLDSGYLSRLLRSLEGGDLIRLTASAVDKRVRGARLTKKGRAEVAVLDRHSDALARSVLASLNPAHQVRLVTAMAEVSKLLTAATVEIDEIDPDHPHARQCLAAYYAELDRRFETGFDPTAGIPVDPDTMRPPSALFLVASLGDRHVGCGALRSHGDQSMEVNRLWVAAEVRGLGVGRRLLQALEDRAGARGSRTVCLDTNRSLDEAIAMYRRAGYHEVAPFNNNPYAHYWFEKHLGAPGDRQHRANLA
jgi:DNA-binding MarR family transcriptional regulator/GNAT superfamily N-acetyltransferase